MTVITTDGEVDDYDSMVRMLLYSNNMDIRGFVYSASQWHWEGDGKGTLLKRTPSISSGSLRKGSVYIRSSLTLSPSLKVLPI